jgi:hypothetical protein
VLNCNTEVKWSDPEAGANNSTLLVVELKDWVAVASCSVTLTAEAGAATCAPVMIVAFLGEGLRNSVLPTPTKRG